MVGGDKSRGTPPPMAIVGASWAAIVSLIAVVATFLAEEARSASIVVRFNEPGDRTTWLDVVAQRGGHALASALPAAASVLAALSGLSAAVYVLERRAWGGEGALKRRLAFGWILGLAAMALIPDGIYLLAPLWALAVVPASFDLRRGLYWRAVEVAAFLIASGLAWGFPLT